MTNLRDKWLMACGFGAGSVTTVAAALVALSLSLPPLPAKAPEVKTVAASADFGDEEKADLAGVKEQREAAAAAFRGLCVERRGSVISSVAGDVACAWPAASWPPSSVPVVGKF